MPFPLVLHQTHSNLNSFHAIKCTLTGLNVGELEGQVTAGGGWVLQGAILGSRAWLVGVGIRNVEHSFERATSGGDRAPCTHSRGTLGEGGTP